MDEEQPTEVRPDGTPIFGPPITRNDAQVAPGRGVGVGLILVAIAIVAALGFLAGRQTAPAPAFHELVMDRAADHCVPLVYFTVANGLGTAEERIRVAQIELGRQGARVIRGDVIEVVLSGTNAWVGIVTWEDCASG